MTEEQETTETEEETGIETEETEAPETGEETEEETPEVTEEETEEEPSIKEVLARLEKSEKRVGYLTRKLNRPGLAPEKEEPLGAEPKESDFENYADYVKALSSWQYRTDREADAKARAKHEATARQEEFFSVIDSGVEKYPDFNEVARKHEYDGGPRITKGMLEDFMECDHPVDVAYYLGQNVGESLRIASMPPKQQSRAIALIDARFSGVGPGKAPQKTTKRVTPSKPATGKTVVETDLADLSDDEFVRVRNARDGVE